MWIVRLALRRPYTFVVMAMLIVIGGVFAIVEMPTDILPEIDIPVIAVVWQYNGLPPVEMEQRFTGNFERALTTTVNGIEHMESQSLYGVSVTKVFFHPGTKMEMANAQVTAISQTLLKQFPVGCDAAPRRQLQRFERPQSFRGPSTPIRSASSSSWT